VVRLEDQVTPASPQGAARAKVMPTVTDGAAREGGTPVAPASMAIRFRLMTSRFAVARLTVFWLLIIAILILPIGLFLMVAISPRLFAQGPEWFTLSGFRRAFSGTLVHGTLDSLGVGVVSAGVAAAIGFGVAWALLRTDVRWSRLWSGSMFVLLLAPSYLIALGWERLLEPGGVLDVLGLQVAGIRGIFYGPVGVVAVLIVKGVPFAYLAVSVALRGLGSELEVAVRVHGGGRVEQVRVVAALLAPAVWSALAIVFAESVSDFGVAATLANDAHFPVATYTLYNAVNAFPADFPAAAAVGWVLMAMAGLALAAQAWATRGRSYRVLGGRTRPARRARLSRRAQAGALGALGLLVLIGVGVPALGAVSASLVNGLGSLVGTHGFTLANYTRVLQSEALRGPLMFSAKLATVTATLTTVLALVTARLLTARTRGIGARFLDLALVTAVALPGIVFAAGYIFTYNMPWTAALGVHLYQTAPLLAVAYLATALPSTSRVLLGAVGQVQESLREAGRVHGSGPLVSWARTVLPLLARPIVAAWVLTFAGTLLELPVSQLLYPPSEPPVSVGITKALANYDFGGGTAMEVLAVIFALAVVAVAWLLFRLLTPAGWRQVGKSL